MRKTICILLIVIAVLVTLCLIVPLMIPVPELEGMVAAEELADQDSQFIEIDGLQVHYKISGQGGPAIVLLHGFVSSVFEWREVIDPLSSYGTVIAFDRTGFGLTERPLQDEWEGESPYSAEAHADMTSALIEALGFDQAVLVGNSAGGSVAVDVALRYPDRVSALVLVDAAVYYEPGPPDWSLWFLRTPQLSRIGPLFLRTLPRYGEFVLNLSWHDPSLVTDDIWEGYIQPTHIHNWDAAFWQLILTTNPPRLEDHISELAVPVLVVTGDDDRVVPTEDSIRLASEIPGAELVVLDQCGHMPQEECPDAFLEAVTAFLATLP
jgi:pimeloyl-ACP methyl ester carboxylesterase